MGQYAYVVELRDRNYKTVKVLNKEIANMDWQYNRIGGCGAFNITLKDAYNDLSSLAVSGDFDVRVRMDALDGSTFYIWYRGYVDRIDENLDKNQSIKISGTGYGRQLARAVVNRSYNNQEVSAVVKDILSSFVVPKTSILQDNTKIHVSSFTANSLLFNTTADKALDTLANLVGFEFGVDNNRTFYFVPAGVTIMHRYIVGGNIEAFSSPRLYDEIVNRLFIEGAEGFTYMVENTSSQSEFGLREEIITNASIKTSGVATQYGGSILADKARPQRRVTINIFNQQQPLELQQPLGRIAIVGMDTSTSKRYASFLYGAGIYGGAFQSQATTLKYKLREGFPSVEIGLGNPKDEYARQLKQLEYEIDNLRSM